MELSDNKCPYSDEELKEVAYSFLDDMLLLVHKNHPPYIVEGITNIIKCVIAEHARKLEPGDK